MQVDFLAHNYEQAMPNYKVLQVVFDRIGIGRVRISCPSRTASMLHSTLCCLETMRM